MVIGHFEAAHLSPSFHFGTFLTTDGGTEFALSASMMVLGFSLFGMIGGAALAVAADWLPTYRVSLERLAGVLLISGLAALGWSLTRCC